ncbi:short tail fiber protein [Vibrio phage vB_ValM_R10Z]|nr:short tail fiber protein [Vibrio phage vB_ValM_R10Z]
MSEFRRAFRASGLDASGQNVINVADPRANELFDGINQGYFIEENTVQEYDPTRDHYKVDFIVEFNQRLYKNITEINAPEPFDSQKWQKMRTDPEWEDTDSSVGANVGDFLLLTASSAITITLPETPLTGDTVTIKDGKGVLTTYPCTIAAAGGLTIQHYGIDGSIESKPSISFNTPNSTIFLVYNGIAWTYQINQELYNTYIDDSHPTQQGGYLSTGGYFTNVGETVTYDGSVKKIAISVPLNPNVGDTIHLKDVAYLENQTSIQIGVNPTATGQVIQDPISGERSSVISLDTIGGADITFIDDNGTGVWVITIANNPHLWNYVGDSSAVELKPRSRYAIEIADAVPAMTITLPEKPADGDWIEISHNKTAHKKVTIQVHPNFGDDDPGHGPDEYKVFLDFETYRYQKYRHYVDFVPFFVESFEISDYDSGYSLVLYYDASRKVWSFGNIATRIDIADELYRKRPGIVPLADPTEALAHGIEYAHPEDAADPWADQNPLKDHVITVETLDARRAGEQQVGMARVATLGTDEALEESRSGTFVRYPDTNFRHDLFITPRSLNARTATETRRGVVEIATQNETRSTTNDVQVLTPMKFHAAQAEEDLTGVAKLVEASNNINAGGIVTSTANMRSDRSVNGLDNTVYDKTDHLRIVTPKMLDEYRATENQPGTLWVAKSSELRINDSTVDNAIITPKKLAAWKASSTVRGIARSATQSEANATTGTGESWTTVFITPETLNSRTATESRRGVAEIATQTEVDSGTDDTRIVSPLKLKTWLDRDHFVTAGTDGLSHTGTVWGDVTFSIASATETQRGTLQVATQVEANAQTGALDDVIITPQKLNARRATETQTGIVRLATQAEVEAATASNEIVITPSDLLHWTRYSDSSRANESRYGNVQIATPAETFVGNSTDGSTQAYTSYLRVPYAVSPYGLHYALRNYLPLNAKADDSELLDGLNSTQFARRDIDQTINGTYTFSGEFVQTKGGGYFLVANPTNDAASVKLDWFNDEPRIRVGGSGNGSSSPFSIAGTGDTTRWQVNSTGYTTQPGGASFGDTIYENEATANVDTTYGSYSSPSSGSLRQKYLGINNVAKASEKWVTARTVTFTGDLSGNFTLDGSGNVTTNIQVNDYSHAHSGENITTGTINNDRLRKSSRTNQGIVQVTSDVRTADPVNASDPHQALSAGAGKTLSERIDLFTPDGGTGESVKYRDYIQVGSVRMSTNNQGVLEFTYGHAI